MDQVPQTIEEEKIDLDFDVEQQTPLLNTIGDVASKAIGTFAGEMGDVVETIEGISETVVRDVGDAVETVGTVVTGAIVPAFIPVPPPSPPSPPPKTVVRTRRVKPSIIVNSINGNAKKITKTKKATKMKIPVVSTVEEWIKYKTIHPNAYTTSPDGLYYSAPLMENGTHESEATLQPKAFFRDTVEAVKQKYINRDTGEESTKIDDAYSEAKVNLRRLYNEFLEAKRNPTSTRNVFNATLSGVINANRRMKEVEQIRNKHYGRTCSIEIVTPQPALDDVQFDMFTNYSPANPPMYMDEMVACRLNRFPWSYFYTDTKPTIVKKEQNGEDGKEDDQMGGGKREQEYTDAQKRIIAGKRISMWRSQKGF